MKPKLCYVLPKFSRDDATHFSHIHDFLKEITKSFDVFLIIENGSEPDYSLGYRHVYVLFFSFFPLRILETKLVLLYARFLGYKDFYIHYSFISAFFASYITRFFGGRTFYWNCGEPWKYKRVFLREFFERFTYRMIHHLVTGAPKLADEYARIYGIKRNSIKVMPNWIDLRRFSSTETKESARRKLNLPLDKKIVLFVHHLSPRKGSRMIVPTALGLGEFLREIIFVVVGSGPDEKYLTELIKKEGLGNTVFLKGSLPNTDIPDYFIASDVFFMPSEEEGFPRVLLESMALGLPFTASNVGVVSEIIPKEMSNCVISPKDNSEFSSKIKEILTQPKTIQEEESKVLRTWVKQYDLPTVVSVFNKLFQQ